MADIGQYNCLYQADIATAKNGDIHNDYSIMRDDGSFTPFIKLHYEQFVTSNVNTEQLSANPAMTDN